jgi:hypothetical protein
MQPAIQIRQAAIDVPAIRWETVVEEAPHDGTIEAATTPNK